MGHKRVAKLLETHAALHACAASVATLALQGDSSAAESQLTAVGSEFNRHSFKMVAFLNQTIRRNAHTDAQAIVEPMTAPASTSLKKCMPNRIREAAIESAQKNNPVARSG